MRRYILRIASLLAVTSTLAGAARAELVSAFGHFDPAVAEEAPSCGPPPCEPRQTLMQWSYGTSVSGGPNRQEPLITDRPDFTETSVTVGRGVTQLEMGYTYTGNDDAGGHNHSNSFPETLLRVGMFAEWFEVRLGWNYGDEFSNPGLGGTSASGSEDVYLGVKLALTPQEGILPEMALTPQMTVPVGGDLSDDEVLPGVNWLYGWDLSERWSIGGSTQGNRAIDDGSGESYLELAQSATVGYSITEPLGSYAEWYVFVPAGAETVGTQHYVNGGFTYKVTNNFQLDARAGLGLSEASDDYFLGAGAAFRR